MFDQKQSNAPAYPIQDAAPSLPKPTTRVAVLWCAALRRPTIHFFVESRRVKRDSFGESAIEFLFQCSITNTIRRYGIVCG